MGFLDDLKRQADALRDQQNSDDVGLQRRIELTDRACQTALAYFNTLADQLEVLKPVSRARYVLDRQHSFSGLAMSDFYADGRRKQVGRGEGFDHVLLHWQLKSGQALRLVKDFPTDIDKLEGRLRQAAVPMEREPVRNPDNGKLIEVRYAVQADFRASVRLTARHERARVQFELHNLDALESLSFELPAEQVDTARLDELARWLTGQPHRMLEGALDLRRAEPA